MARCKTWDRREACLRLTLSLSKTLYPLLSTGLTQEMSQGNMTEKLLTARQSIKSNQSITLQFKKSILNAMCVKGPYITILGAG